MRDSSPFPNKTRKLRRLLIICITLISSNHIYFWVALKIITIICVYRQTEEFIIYLHIEKKRGVLPLCSLHYSRHYYLPGTGDFIGIKIFSSLRGQANIDNKVLELWKVRFRELQSSLPKGIQLESCIERSELRQMPGSMFNQVASKYM